jgi:hypothetical protein
LAALAIEAKEFILSQKWCRKVCHLSIGMGYEGIVGVFFVEIEPTRNDIDASLWVVVGDLPPAYLVCDNSPDAAAALEGYIEEMRRWVDALRRGLSLDDIIPVNAPPTGEYADLLAGRLNFLEREVLVRFRAGEPDDTARL